jgi:tetratricopeptide (TPR) repeat protein
MNQATAKWVQWRQLLPLVVLAAALLVGCERGPTPEQVNQFEAALQAFQAAQSAEDYQRVAAMYQEIIDEGTISGALLYNQGNAFILAGKRGHAIACYRHALRYRPRDEQLRASLRNALGSDQVSARRPLIQHILFWQDWISYPGKTHATTALALVTIVLGLAGLYSHVNAFRWLAAILLAATLTLAVSAAYDWYRFDHVRHGVITAAEVTARKGNGTTFEPAFTTSLAEATEFIVLEQRGQWLDIRLEGGQTGWIPAADAAVY